MKLLKNTLYKVNGIIGQYELTTKNGRECFFMYNTNDYEYFDNPIIEEPSKEEVKEILEP